MTFADRLVKIKACRGAVRWVRNHGYGLKKAWARCPHGGWMQWLGWMMRGSPGWPSVKRYMSVTKAANDAWKKALHAGQDHNGAERAVWRKLYKLGPVEEIGR